MRLQEFEPRNYRSFGEGQILKLDPQVTVITGPNDSGKSNLLRWIEAFYANVAIGSSSDVNSDFLRRSNGEFEKNERIGGRAVFEKSGPWQNFFNQHAVGGKSIEVNWCAAPKNRYRNFRTTGGDHGLQSLPPVVTLRAADYINDTIDLGKPTPSEIAFLHCAFGASIEYLTMDKWDTPTWATMWHEAQDRINGIIEPLLPDDCRVQIQFEKHTDGKKNQLLVLLRDRTGVACAFGARGDGVKRIISVAALVASRLKKDEPLLLLMDEPEAHLHPYAQHRFRRYLFDLVQETSVQIIYSTHSPTMIDRNRPENVRILRRAATNGVAFSELVNKAYQGNWLLVRDSLGTNPADSLTYGEVVVVVEGETERLALPEIFRRMGAAYPDDFKHVDDVLDRTVFLGGEGDSYEYFVRLAKANGSNVVVFLDGDKTTQAEKVKQKHAETQIILLDSDKEFEDVVPLRTYLAAVGSVCELRDPNQLTERAIEEIRSKGTRMTSKAVSAHLKQNGIEGYSKPEAMWNAVEQTDGASFLHRDKLTKLFESVVAGLGR